MRPIDRIALFDALLESLPDTDFRELKVTTVYDDHERYPVFVCPWCREHLHGGDIVKVDADIRSTASGETTPDDGVRFDDDENDDETDTQTLYFKCGECGSPVSIPANVRRL
jgi:hypothetical protein